MNRAKLIADIDALKREHTNLKINHILHLLLSILTLGVWVIVWVMISHKSVSRRQLVEKLIYRKIVELESDKKKSEVFFN